jgi:hypothetical protein
VALPPGTVVAQFRKFAQLEHSNKLISFDAADLLVYKNKAAFNRRSSYAEDDDHDGHAELQPLDPTQSVHGLGSKEDMLVVVVPPSSSYASSSSTSQSQSTSESCPEKAPDQRRKQRWNELNQILDNNMKKSKTNDSTSYSPITWNQVKSVFNPTRYVQPQRAMEEAQIDFLAQYLSYTTQCFGPITTGKEAKRLHFIAHATILAMVGVRRLTLVVIGRLGSIHDDRRCILIGADETSILVGCWEKRSASNIFEAVEECKDHGIGVIGDEAYFGIVVIILSPGFRVDSSSVFVSSVIIVMTGVKVGSPESS